MSPIAKAQMLAASLVALMSSQIAAADPLPPDGTSTTIAPSASDTAAAPAPPAAEAAPKPPPYSLPWQLRPIAPANVIRLDSALDLADDRTVSASTLLVAYKVTDWLAPLVRVGLVSHSPDTGESATNIENPVLGALAGFKLAPSLKLGAFLGVTLPIGQGGGDPSDPARAAANGPGMMARSAMDNAMLAVDYLTVFPGVGIAYINSGLTLQAEATLLQLTKARGPDAADDSRTNLTMGLHAGYFLIPSLSVGAELRHQRWLSTPTPVKANSSLRDTTTVAIGPRFHVKLAEKMFLRPGVAFAMPIDDPMADTGHKILFFDVPFTF